MSNNFEKKTIIFQKSAHGAVIIQNGTEKIMICRSTSKNNFFWKKPMTTFFSNGISELPSHC